MKGIHNMNIIIKRSILFTAAILLLLCTFGCSVSGPSYENNPSYSHLFVDTDDAAAKELKNQIIAQLIAYNDGDAEGYYALFNMEKEDLNFNVAQFNAMRQTVNMTYTPESIQTAFINEDNAQALITMTCRGDDKSTGEVLYYYRTAMTYTMVRDGKWTVTLQTPGHEEDLMYTLSEGTEPVTQ